MSVRPDEPVATDIEGWRFDSFSNAVEVNPRRQLVQGKEYPFIPMEALSTDSPNLSFTRKRVWGPPSGTRFQTGDVLFARITPSAENGKTALCDLPSALGFGSTEFIVLGPKKGGVEDSKFLYHLVKFERIRRQAIQRMTGSTGRRRVPPEAFDDILCPIPPLSEQERIGTILSTVDHYIQKTDEIIAKTQQLKKGLMHELLTKGVGHTKFRRTEIGEIPDKWGVVELSDVCSEVTIGVVNQATPFYTSSLNGVPYFRSQNVRENTLDDTDVYVTSEFNTMHERSKLKENDVLTLQTGFIGTSCLVSKKYEGANCHSLLITRTNRERLDPRFFCHLLNSDQGRKLIGKFALAVERKHILLQDFRVMKIPLPPLPEQRQITDTISSTYDLIQSNKNRRDALQQLKRGLMQVLLIGKVRVKVD